MLLCEFVLMNTRTSVLHHNLRMRCEPMKAENVVEIAFPTKNYKQFMIIGFPTEE